MTSQVIKKWQQTSNTAVTSSLQILNHKKLPIFSIYPAVSFWFAWWRVRRNLEQCCNWFLRGMRSCTVLRYIHQGHSQQSFRLCWGQRDVHQTLQAFPQATPGKSIPSSGLPSACVHMHIHDWLFFRVKKKISLENCISTAGLCFQVFCLSQKKIADAMKSFVQP